MSNYPTHDAISEASINLTSFHKAFGKSSRAEAVKKHKQALVDGYFGKEAKRRSKLSPNDPSSGKFAKMMCKNFEGRENFLLRETQKVFQNATKINIGQSLIEHAVEATEMPPKDLLNAFMTGIPAFNSMWIEWDMGFGSDHMKIFSDVGEPRSGSQFRTGYLIQKVGWAGELENNLSLEERTKRSSAKNRTSTINSVWTPNHRMTPEMGFESDWFEFHKFMHFPESDKNMLVAPRCGVLFSYGQEEGVTRVEGGTGVYKHDDSHLPPDKIKEAREKHGANVLTPEYVSHFSNKKSQKAFLNGLFSRFGFCQHLFAPLLEDRYASNWQGDYLGYFGDTGQELLEIGGWSMDLRFVIAVLGLLNYQREVERDIEIVDNDDIEKPLVLHEPINEVKVVEINLPKDAGVKLYGKIFKQCMLRQRRHLRRGHWRKIHYKSGLIKRKWVQPYWAGDAKLGTIIHDYHLVNKKAG